MAVDRQRREPVGKADDLRPVGDHVGEAAGDRHHRERRDEGRQLASGDEQPRHQPAQRRGHEGAAAMPTGTRHAEIVGMRHRSRSPCRRAPGPSRPTGRCRRSGSPASCRSAMMPSTVTWSRMFRMLRTVRKVSVVSDRTTQSRTRPISGPFDAGEQGRQPRCGEFAPRSGLRCAAEIVAHLGRMLPEGAGTASTAGNAVHERLLPCLNNLSLPDRFVQLNFNAGSMSRASCAGALPRQPPRYLFSAAAAKAGGGRVTFGRQRKAVAVSRSGAQGPGGLALLRRGPDAGTDLRAARHRPDQGAPHPFGRPRGGRGSVPYPRQRRRLRRAGKAAEAAASAWPTRWSFRQPPMLAKRRADRSCRGSLSGRHDQPGRRHRAGLGTDPQIRDRRTAAPASCRARRWCRCSAASPMRSRSTRPKAPGSWRRRSARNAICCRCRSMRTGRQQRDAFMSQRSVQDVMLRARRANLRRDQRRLDRQPTARSPATASSGRASSRSSRPPAPSAISFAISSTPPGSSIDHDVNRPRLRLSARRARRHRRHHAGLRRGARRWR